MSLRGFLFCEKSCGRKAVIVNAMICKCEIPSKVELQNLTNLTATRRTPPFRYKMTRPDQIGLPVACSRSVARPRAPSKMISVSLARF